MGNLILRKKEMHKNKIVKNSIYALSSNMVTMLISVVMVIVLPKIVTVEDYGVWQLYVFYASYIGFMHFGWEDGIYLRYAGHLYSELNQKLFAGQIYSLMLLQVIIASVIFIVATLVVINPEKQFILTIISLALIFTNFNNLCNFIFQITNRIAEYSFRVVLERIVFIALLVVSFLVGNLKYQSLLYAQLIALILVTVVSAWSIRNLLKPTFSSLQDIKKEAIENLSAGSKLMLSNIASLLIVGIIRYGISENWSIATFGKVSFTLSISSFFMVAINAGSVVLFPILKRLDTAKLIDAYINLREILSDVTLALLILYYPIKFILACWLPQYGDSLFYMAILFPICIFESRVSLLINTYLKTMRRERNMLVLNAIAAIISLMLMVVGCYWLHNLDFMVLSIVLSLGIRCIILELYLEVELGIKFYKEIIIELGLIGIFMISNREMSSLYGMCIYLIAILFFLTSRKKVLVKAIKWLKS